MRLLGEALRRDIHFIARHAEDYPQALFQCLWNTGWWYDSPAAAKHYESPEGGWSAEDPPWERPGPKLSAQIEKWRSNHQQSRPLLRTSRPPTLPLGSAQRAVFRGHTDQDSSVAFSPDGRRTLSGSGDRTVRVWDAESGEQLELLEGHTNSVTSVMFSPDGRRILVGFYDETVLGMDTETGECLEVIEGTSDVQAIAAGSESYPYRLISRGLETVVEAATSGKPIAWPPVFTFRNHHPPLRQQMSRSRREPRLFPGTGRRHRKSGNLGNSRQIMSQTLSPRSSERGWPTLWRVWLPRVCDFR